MDIGIGELSRRTGVKVPTIRFYEQIGLLAAPPRTGGNQRRYGKTEADTLNFIRHSRELGFDVDDIRDLLKMAASPQSSCHEVDSIAVNHLKTVDRRIASLTVLRSELGRMIEECDRGRICDCRIIEVLADHSQCVSPDHARPD